MPPFARVLHALIMNLGTAAACAVLLIATAHARADERTPRAFDIGPQNLAAALSEYARQSEQEILFSPHIVADKSSSGIRGSYPPLDALKGILQHTGLTFTVTPSGAILVQDPSATITGSASGSLDDALSAFSGMADASDTSLSAKKGWFDRFRLAQNSGGNTSASTAKEVNTSESQELPAPEETTKGIPEVLVEGSKVLNMDIRRNANDPQPYVILDRQLIQQSGAINVNDFLKQRLTMNTVGLSSGQQFSIAGNASTVNLRGLGQNQTLILVDGHRVSDFNIGNTFLQPSISAIPITAVERIEVLPTTASGIYGGSATGGVVNVILRRDYSGAEVKLTYDNTFDSDSSLRRIDASTGFSLEGGRTDVLLAGTFSETNELLTHDRSFAQSGRAAVLANRPATFLAAANPPLGATPNIRSVNGSNLVLANGTPLNSPITYVPPGYAGAASDGGAALVANAGRYNLDLANSAQLNGGEGQALLNGPTLKSIMATVRREFSTHVQAFVEAAASDSLGYFSSSFAGLAGPFVLPASAPNNPFGQAIRVSVPLPSADGQLSSTTQDRRIVGGVIVRLPHSWTAEADYTWQRYRLDYSWPQYIVPAGIEALTNGTLDILRDPNAFPLDVSSYLGGSALFESNVRSTIEDATLRLSGPIGSLPGGRPEIAALIEHRDISLGESLNLQPGFGVENYYPSRSQSVDSAYIEIRIPLVSASNAVRGVHELELQLAVRSDQYKTNGAGNVNGLPLGSPIPAVARATNEVRSTNPTFALRYQPLRDLMLRASYGTGFQPPNVTQIASTHPTGNPTVVDPRRGNTPITIPLNQVLGGGSPALRPEESESWSAGVVVTPRIVPALRLSLDYTRIKKTDNIASLGFQGQVDNETLFPERVTRGSNLPGDQPGWAGPITFLDSSLLNFARADVEAYDAQLDYRVETANAGVFDLFAYATRQTHYETQFLPTSPLIENAGVTSNNPLKFKANTGLTWTRAGWTLGWTARYFDDYRVSTNTTVIQNQGNSGRVASQIYHDAFVSWSAPEDLGTTILENTEIQLGVRNVFNKEPPLDVANSGSGYYSPFGDPRLASYYLSLRRSF